MTGCHDDDEFEKHLDEDPDPQLDPERSPGLHTDIEALEDIEVSREDVTIGEATPEELAASDTEPVADDAVASLLSDIEHGAKTDRRRAALDSRPRVHRRNRGGAGPRCDDRRRQRRAPVRR